MSGCCEKIQSRWSLLTGVNGLYCLVVEPGESKVRISGRDAESLFLVIAAEATGQRQEDYEQTG